MRYATRDGRWTVDVISLILTGTGRDGAWLRVREWGFAAGEVRTSAELFERFRLNPADLAETLLLARRRLAVRLRPGARRRPGLSPARG
jgi:hypothetical protein